MTGVGHGASPLDRRRPPLPRFRSMGHLEAAAYHRTPLASFDARDAALLVAIDTELPEDVAAVSGSVVAWGGFPPMRERYVPSRAALKTRIEALVERLARAEDRTAPRSASAAPRSRAAR